MKTKKITIENILDIAHLDPVILEKAREMRACELRVDHLRDEIEEYLSSGGTKTKTDVKKVVKKSTKKAAKKAAAPKPFPSPPKPKKKTARNPEIKEDVLAALDLKSPQSITHIKQSTGRTFDLVALAVQQLTKEGTIKKVTFRPTGGNRDLEGYVRA